MIRYILLFWLVAATALAQQPQQQPQPATAAQRLQQVIANLIGENAELAVQIDRLTIQMNALRAQIMKDREKLEPKEEK